MHCTSVVQSSMCARSHATYTHEHTNTFNTNTSAFLSRKTCINEYFVFAHTHTHTHKHYVYVCVFYTQYTRHSVHMVHGIPIARNLRETVHDASATAAPSVCVSSTTTSSTTDSSTPLNIHTHTHTEHSLSLQVSTDRRRRRREWRRPRARFSSQSVQDQIHSPSLYDATHHTPHTTYRMLESIIAKQQHSHLSAKRMCVFQCVYVLAIVATTITAQRTHTHTRSPSLKKSESCAHSTFARARLFTFYAVVAVLLCSAAAVVCCLHGHKESVRLLCVCA